VSFPSRVERESGHWSLGFSIDPKEFDTRCLTCKDTILCSSDLEGGATLTEHFWGFLFSLGPEIRLF
jgi:hypothetical protein